MSGVIGLCADLDGRRPDRPSVERHQFQWQSRHQDRADQLPFFQGRQMESVALHLIGNGRRCAPLMPAACTRMLRWRCGLLQPRRHREALHGSLYGKGMRAVCPPRRESNGGGLRYSSVSRGDQPAVPHRQAIRVYRWPADEPCSQWLRIPGSVDQTFWPVLAH